MLKKTPASPEGRPPLPTDSTAEAAGVEPPPGVQFLGRPTLLWLLEHPELAATDCLGGEIEGGRVLVRVTRGGLPHAARLFPNATAAVQWALELEAALMNQGWTKTI